MGSPSESATDETTDATSAPTSTVVVPSGASPDIAVSLLIDGEPGLNLKVQAGEEARGDVTLAPGEYVLYCDIAGHREAGMESKLHVK